MKTITTVALAVGLTLISPWAAVAVAGAAAGYWWSNRTDGE
jgi:hypothetical protein